jgi:ComF family protein
MFEQIISLIAPHTCLGCRKEGSLLCDACQGLLPAQTLQERTGAFLAHKLNSQYLQSVFSATMYAGIAQELIHTLKFERAPAAADTIAAIMAGRMHLPSSGTVTFVPTAASRVRMRGYDQAELIARRVAAACQLPCTPLLQRTGRQRQVGQGREVRRHQLQGVFQMRNHAPVSDAVLLIDDVLTTGATLEAAAAVLHDAGAATIHAAVFAAA